MYLNDTICKSKTNFIAFVGTELGGDVVHSSMYQHLWTNAPKVSLHYERQYAIMDCLIKSIWQLFSN